MYILCIETGTDTCSVALARDGALVALRESSDERDHARRVAVYTEEVLAEGGIGASDLSAVAVSKGPGSYTGLRIGVSFAKGLCYGLGIPLIGVGSLDSLCEMARDTLMSGHSVGMALSVDNRIPIQDASRTGCDRLPEPNFYRQIFPTGIGLLIPMIDARRMEVFGQVFDAEGNPVTQPGAWIIDEGSLAEYSDRDVYVFGSGAAKCREILPWAHYMDVRPSARGMIKLAAEAFENKNFENTAYFEPFYLKDFVITTSKKKLF